MIPDAQTTFPLIATASLTSNLLFHKNSELQTNRHSVQLALVMLSSTYQMAKVTSANYNCPEFSIHRKLLTCWSQLDSLMRMVFLPYMVGENVSSEVQMVRRLGRC